MLTLATVSIKASNHRGGNKTFHDKIRFKQHLHTNPAPQKAGTGKLKLEEATQEKTQ